MRPKRPGLKLGLLLLAGLTAAIVGTLGTLHYSTLYQRVANAKELLLTAQESLQERRLDATASELAEARAQLSEAEEGFRSVRPWYRPDDFPEGWDDYSRAVIEGAPTSLNGEAARA